MRSSNWWQHMGQRDGLLWHKNLKNTIKSQVALVNSAEKGNTLAYYIRWHNHLDPYIKKDPINKEEEKKIFDLHKSLGNKWADIAKELPGRSDNCIKNYFYSTHRKH